MIDDILSGGNIVEDALEIDIDSIDQEAGAEAHDVIAIVSNLYHDKTFLEKHPQIKARLDIELDTLRGLLKMRKADEAAHDGILIALSSRKDNPALYRALADIQKTSIAVSNKIHDTIDRINQICKEVIQMDMPQEEAQEEDEESQKTADEIKSVHRGSKAFIMEALKQAVQNQQEHAV